MDHASTLRELFQQVEENHDSPIRSGPSEDPGPSHAADDKKRLEMLFGEATTRPAQTATRKRQPSREGPWPEHNYNEAYHQITRHRPRVRRNQNADESTLWEISDLLEEEADDPNQPPAPPEPPAQKPWPDHLGIDLSQIQAAVDETPARAPSLQDPAPTKWLDALEEAPALPTTTEAHLIGTLRGDTDIVRRPLFDTTQTLHARAPGDLRSDPVGEPTTASSPSTSTSATSTPTSTSTSTPFKNKESVLRRSRGLILKFAGVVLGLKIGVSAGYLLATLL